MEEIIFKANQQLSDYLIENDYEEENHIDHLGNKGKRRFYLFTNKTKKPTNITMSIRFNYINIEAWYGHGQIKKWTSISKSELDKLIVFQKQKKHSDCEINNYR